MMCDAFLHLNSREFTKEHFWSSPDRISAIVEAPTTAVIGEDFMLNLIKCAVEICQ